MRSRGRGIYIVGKKYVTHSRLFLVQTVSYFVYSFSFASCLVYLVKMQDPSTSSNPPPSTEASNTGGISAAHFQLLMDEIKKNREDVQQRLDKLEEDVAVGHDNAAQIVVQKLKADRSYTFRKKGTRSSIVLMQISKAI